MRRHPRRSAIVALALVSAGCGGQSEASTDGDLAGGPAAARQTSRSDTIEVQLTEYAIDMRQVLSAGPIVLRVSNGGLEVHDLQFTRQGADSAVWRLEKRLDPGEVRVVSLVLAGHTAA